MNIVSNQWEDIPIQDSLTRLFEEDGTIYLVPGYFTSGAYQSLKPTIEEFLARTQTNEIVIIVSPTADQFAAQIGHDISGLRHSERISIYKYPNRCLHAKLYLRTGENPAAIIGSVNLTRVALNQNVELSMFIEGTDADDERIARLTEWVTQLQNESTPLTRRDMFWPVMAFNSLSIWANKARLIQRKPVTYQPVIYLMVVLVGVYLLFFV